MSATGQVAKRGVRHPMSVVTQARKYADVGWGPAEIVRLLARDGVTVHHSTIAIWTRPEVAERQSRNRHAWNRRKSATRSGRLGQHGPKACPEFKIARMRALHELGVPCSAIARVMAFDFGDHWLTKDNVRYAITSGHYPQEKTA